MPEITNENSKIETPVSTTPPEAPKIDNFTAQNSVEGLIKQANETQGENRGFMEPKDSVKKSKGGRPRKDPNDPKWANRTVPGPQAQSGVMPATPGVNIAADFLPAFKGLFTVSSGMLVRSTGLKETALDPSEIEGLSMAWSAVAARYLPAAMQQYAELIGAVTITGAVGYRIYSVVHVEIERRKREMMAAQMQSQRAEMNTGAMTV